jgi:hypothetical protein
MRNTIEEVADGAQGHDMNKKGNPELRVVQGHTWDTWHGQAILQEQRRGVLVDVLVGGEFLRAD